MDVSRGFSESDKMSYWKSAEQLQPPPYGSHSPTISLPTSFPNIFKEKACPKTLNAFSSLETTPQTARLFQSYATIVGNCLGRHADVVQRMGLEPDDIRELREELWALEDAYKDESAEDGLDEAKMGEDEDFQ